jgi:hypothetical protein
MIAGIGDGDGDGREGAIGESSLPVVAFLLRSHVRDGNMESS